MGIGKIRIAFSIQIPLDLSTRHSLCTSPFNTTTETFSIRIRDRHSDYHGKRLHFEHEKFGQKCFDIYD